MSNKRGDIENIFLIVLLFIIGIVLFAVYLTLSSAQPAFSGSTYANNLVNGAMKFISRLGTLGFISILFALLAVNIFGSYFLLTHPLFVIGDILMFSISIWVASIMSNAYEASISTQPIMAASLPGVHFILMNLPYVIVVMDLLVAVFKYALVKTRM